MKYKTQIILWHAFWAIFPILFSIIFGIKNSWVVPFIWTLNVMIQIYIAKSRLRTI